MSAPVDVLAVIESAAVTMHNEGFIALPPKLRDAYDAVAELIEADREFDAAADALAAAKREKGSWRTNPLGDGHPAVLRMREAKARRTTALARIGGAE